MENNSKQAVLSIVGIAILVIAVVGVSFAFFTYSKTGTTNNVITTGSITFTYNEVNELSLTNQFPVDPTTGKGNATFDFSVVGNLPTTSNAVNYTVTAIAGTVPDTYVATNRLADADINVYVTATGGGTVSNGYDGTNGAVAGNSTSGFQIASGTIAATGASITHNYTMTMWVNQTVTISDTDTSKTYRASTGGPVEDTRKVYSEMYYSLKVNVSATDVI